MPKLTKCDRPEKQTILWTEPRDTIDAEISKYKKESNTRKRQVLNRVLALDSFRVALSDERQTLNKGLLYFGLSVSFLLSMYLWLFSMNTAIRIAAITAATPNIELISTITTIIDRNNSIKM